MIDDEQVKALKPAHMPDLLGGVTVLRGEVALAEADWGETLYATRAPAYTSTHITAVPYCVWDNRDAGGMRVWLRNT